MATITKTVNIDLPTTQVGGKQTELRIGFDGARQIIFQGKGGTSVSADAAVKIEAKKFLSAARQIAEDLNKVITDLEALTNG